MTAGEARRRGVFDSPQLLSLDELMAREKRLWEREKMSLGRFEEVSEQQQQGERNTYTTTTSTSASGEKGSLRL